MSRWKADYESLVNRGEYFSSYYLTQVAHRDLSGIFKTWDEEEGSGKTTPRSGVHGLAGDYFELRPEVAETDPDDLESWREGTARGALTELHALVLGER